MHDVVIVGAGPVGLMLACELGLAGCSVLVLEREPDPHTPWRAAPLGLRGLSATSVEAFDRRGLLPALLTASGIGATPAYSEEDELAPPYAVGHFGGMMLDSADVDVAALPYRIPGPAPEFVMTSLEAVESVLSGRAGQLGVEIRRGRAVSAITQDADGVLVHAGEHTYPARWVVGCDGGHSAVRGLAGFEFTGTEPQFTGYVMLADVAGLEKLRPGFNPTPTGMYLRLPTDGHIGMMDFDAGAFDRSQEPTRDHLQEVLRRVSGTDVTLTDVRLASSFTDRAMQATTYRRGRVLLAGDAAHIHSPLGGQGLHTGIGDAVNLGWKLAATVHGYAPEGLLDTYTSERHPVAAWVLDWTRAQAVVMRPSPYARATQGLMRDLLGTRDVTTYVFGKLSGWSIRYELGVDHPLAGRNAPDLRLRDGTRLGELMQDGRGLLLDFSGGLGDAAAGWEGRIRCVTGAARNDLGLSAVLIRPDGTVAWAVDGTPDRDVFERTAGQWFGTSAPVNTAR